MSLFIVETPLDKNTPTVCKESHGRLVHITGVVRSFLPHDVSDGESPCRCVLSIVNAAPHPALGSGRYYESCGSLIVKDMDAPSMVVDND